MNNISKLKEYSHKKLDEQFDELQNILDKNESINKFFNLLTYKFNSPIKQYSNESKTNLDYVASSVLNKLVGEIWNSLDINFVPDSLDVSWLENLNSFIINVFLDDSGFSISNDKFTNEWTCSPHNKHRLQNPDILIFAAYDVAKFWIEIEQNKNGLPKLELMKRGMISSGEVEKLIF